VLTTFFSTLAILRGTLVFAIIDATLDFCQQLILPQFDAEALLSITIISSGPKQVPIAEHDLLRKGCKVSNLVYKGDSQSYSELEEL